MITCLDERGFRQYKSCNCSGGKLWLKSDTMPGVEVIIFKRSTSYEIKRSGKVINRGLLHQLENEFNMLFNVPKT